MTKVKNSATDIFLFGLYHVVAVVGTVAFFIALTQGVDSLKFGSISFFKQKLTGAATSIEAKRPTISSVRGEVFIAERGRSLTPATEGQNLKEGSVIETRDKSTAVVTFGESYTCRVRISANSRVNLDTLLAQDEVKKTEGTLLNLVKGGIYLLLQNESKEAEVRVKTFSTVFAIRGTNIAVLTDGTKSILGVKEGNVEAENLKTSAKSAVYAGASYLADASGAEKVNLNPKVLEQFNFDETTDAVVPDIQTVSPAIGELTVAAPEADPAVAEKAELLAAIKLEVDAFKKENDQIAADVEIEKTNLENMQAKHADEVPKLNDDMSCIESSAQPCKLYAQDLLISRGFPRTFGDPRVRRSLVQDLRKYVVEQETKIEEQRTLIKNTEALLVKRAEALKWAQEAVAAETGLEQILPRLQDKQLQR